MSKLIVKILLALISLPILCLSFPIFTSQGFNYFIPRLFVEYLGNTVFLMIGTGILTFVIGVGAAILVNFFEFPGRKLLKNSLFIPLALPAYILALVYTQTADSLHIFHISHLGSLCFAVLTMAMCFYPYVYLIVSSRLASLKNTVSIARIMGKKPIDIFLSLIVPMSRPAIIAGISLVLMEVIADFGTVEFFSIQTFTTAIYRNHFLLNNHFMSAILTFVLLASVLLLVYWERKSRKNTSYSNIVYTNEFHNTKWQLKGYKAFSALIFCITPILLGFVAPVLILISWATKSTLSIGKISILLNNTIILAGTSATIIIFIALVIVYSCRTKEIKPWMMRIACIGYAVPGLVVAIAVLTFLGYFGNSINAVIKYMFNIDPSIILIGTIFALIYSYTFRFISVAVGSIESSMDKIPKEIDMTLRLLSKSYIQKLDLYVSMITKSIYTAFILVFLEVIKELPATLIVRPFNFETFSTKIFLLVMDERHYDAAVPALIVATLGAISVFALTKLLYNKSLHNINSNATIKCLCDVCIGIKNEC